MRLLLALMLIFLTTNIYAKIINSIEYEGVVHISKSVALRMLEFSAGEEVSDKEIDLAIKKYFKQGYFKDIRAEVEGDVLTFYFVEKPLISKIEVEGYKDSDKEFKDNVIRIKRGTLYDEKKLEAAKQRIIDAISQDGKIDSVVEIKKEYLENGSIKVIFAINEGEKIIITKLDYSGVKGIDSEEFDSVIANKEAQWMGWFYGRNDGKMSLADMSYDHLRIRDYYMQYGYLDAKVESPFVKVDFNDYTASMSYQIKEGEAYTVNKITLLQTINVIDEAKIKEVVTLEENKPFNIKTFREDAQRIKTLIADLSYAFVQVVPDLKKNVKDKTVEVVFRITPGYKVKIRNVLIAGNTRTLDRIIRRELYLGPGDMYSLTDLTDSRNSLGRLGFFEGQTIEEKRIDNQTMDLIVKVKEAPTGNIQLGGGYGSYGGLLISVAVNDRNVWGSGINVGIKAEKSETTRNYSFNISNNRLNDSDFSGNFSIFKSEYTYNDYTVKSEGISVGSGHRFSRHISGYVGYGYSKNKYDLDDDYNTTSTTNFFFESYAKSAVTMSAKFDNTDDYYLPRKGFTLSQSFEKSGLGAEANFFKSRTSFGFYRGLEEQIGFDAIFRYKAKYNISVDNGYLPVAERFYLGGIGSVRGYQSYALSPYIIDENGLYRRVGGEQSFSNSLELSLPLVPKAKMRIVLFVDWGLIGDADITQISRGGYGAGLEWFSPVGPIQLMFARALNQNVGYSDTAIANGLNDNTSNFEFTMGQRF